VYLSINNSQRKPDRIQEPCSIATYVRGALYTIHPNVSKNIKGYGFSRIIAGSVNFGPKGKEGPIVFNSYPQAIIINKGKYVGLKGWPKWLAGLKQNGAVNSIFLSILFGWAWLKKEGFGKNGIVYKNFK